jgi:hypothetical protein
MDNPRCVCGHFFDEHNDITHMCLYYVVLSDEDETISCTLCPPKGFSPAVEGRWPQEWPIAS